ncbi:hypothetical protein CBR_g83883 [Chara braunii]|uniref:Uncharacterized protein n=1 Tax=Chara braunii TaxID=69332 RepID=A0A388JJM2_CHABU|nr:hypothetical protein CBR_g83883 [Chara braunii]|eukprot:GBG42143.1 hypothetical protein CBR_g83883 [Chara braunii]
MLLFCRRAVKCILQSVKGGRERGREGGREGGREVRGEGGRGRERERERGTGIVQSVEEERKTVMTADFSDSQWKCVDSNSMPDTSVGLKWTTRLDAEWVFIPGVDCPGNDIERNPSLVGKDKFPNQRLHAEAMVDPVCVAFNTDGWFKSKLLPKSQWVKITAPSSGYFTHGLWVRRRALADLEWVLMPGMDSPDFDIVPQMSKRGDALRELAENTGEMCVAYNDAGYLKYHVRPRWQWARTAELNLWVRRSVLDKLHP